MNAVWVVICALNVCVLGLALLHLRLLGEVDKIREAIAVMAAVTIKQFDRDAS